MERTAYTLLYKMESSWCYRGRAWAVRAAATHVNAMKCALDYGAGYGGMHSTLRRFVDNVDAFEPDKEARDVATSRGYGKVFSSENAAFANTYDLICLFDVLEHLEDDRAFLERARNALESSGRLMITVPAFQKLWSSHDVEHHHYRRYTTRSLARILREAGYQIDYIGYWNCVMLLPAAILRVMGMSGEGGLSPATIINAVLTLIVRVEALIMRYMPLPFGLSVIVVATKIESEDRV